MSDYISCTEVAKLVRDALKAAFGNYKFSVTSHHYTTIYVRWIDGPSIDEVDAIVKQFNGSTFDGMEDLRTSVTSIHPVTGQPVHYGSDWVHAERRTSAELMNKFIALLVEKFHIDAKLFAIYPGINDTVSANIPWEADIEFNLREIINRELHKLSHTYSAMPAKQIRVKGTLTFERGERDGSQGYYIGGDTWPKQGQIKAAGGKWIKDQKRYWLQVDEIPAELQALSIPVEEAQTVTSALIADRLEKTADAMQKDIDHKRREMTQNPTHKRNRELESRLNDANKLEALQDKIRAIATAHRAATVPANVIGLTSKALIAYVLNNKTMPTVDGWNTATRAALIKAGIGNDSVYEDARTYLLGLGNPEAGKESAADKIAKQEREVSLMPIPGFFPTPSEVVARMIAAADIEPGMSVLEPSAGKGDIADAIPNGASVDVIELSSRLRDLLTLKGYTLIDSDFMTFESDKLYDRVIMNPPFERGQDMDHVRRAYMYLRPGGRLIAIMSNHAFFANDSKSVEFRKWLGSIISSSQKLPDDAFMSSDRPTGVSTKLVIIDKPTTSEIYKLNKKIEQAQAKIDRAEPVFNQIGGIPGPFVTGRSNYPVSLGKALDRENDKRAAAFSTYQTATADKKHAESILAGVKAGEIHPNGQRRADAPSRIRAEEYARLRGAFVKSLIRAGDNVAVAGVHNANQITIKRVNEKSLTAASGSKWEFWEVRPLIDGVPMTDKQFSAAFLRWKNQRAAVIDADNDYLWQFDDAYPAFDTITTEAQPATAPTTTAPDDAPTVAAANQTVEFTVDNLVMVGNRIGIVNVEETAMQILRGLEGKYKITIEAIPAA